MATDTSERRRGGRSARRASRAAPPAAADRPVWPGLEGGRFRPLDDGDAQRIHETALQVLEQIGLAGAIPSCVEAMTRAGAVMGNDGRLRLPRALVEDTIARAGRHFPLHARAPEHDLEPWGRRIHFGTAGAAVHMVDARTGAYRDSQLSDLYDIARLVDRLEHVHFLQRPVVPRDLPEPAELDINTCYACVSGTRKHVGTSWTQPEHLEASLQMLHMIAGDEARWRERPFVSMSCCFVVPPLTFAEDACRVMETGIRGGMPILLLAAGQAGATSPPSLAGAVVQQVAEVLAGLVYVNAVHPGHPAIFGTWPFVSDLRTGAMSGGSGEQAVLMAACAQMAAFYDLPGGVCAGMADSKIPDAQAGYEKGYNYGIVGHSGANLVYESAGMHASLLGCCLESFVMDNDAIGAVLRSVRGIEVNDETLAFDAIRSVCIDGPGHYLGHEQTLARMQRDYVYPAVADRTSPKEWIENGSSDIVDRARERTGALLAEQPCARIDAELDRRLRAAFAIRIPREVMYPE